MDLLLRPMRPADLDAIEEIERRSFHTPWSREAFQEELCNPLAGYIVAAQAEGADMPIGYAGCWYIVDEGHITNVAVHPDWRGRGVGKALMERLIADAARQGIYDLTLEVREKNTVAQQLYRRFGFLRVGERKGYYADTGENAWIMWRRGTGGGETL